MSEQGNFQAGEKVVLKNNHRIIYIYLSDDGTKALCLSPDNVEVQLYLVAIEKYTPPSFF